MFLYILYLYKWKLIFPLIIFKTIKEKLINIIYKIIYILTRNEVHLLRSKSRDRITSNILLVRL